MRFTLRDNHDDAENVYNEKKTKQKCLFFVVANTTQLVVVVVFICFKMLSMYINSTLARYGWTMQLC